MVEEEEDEEKEKNEEEEDEEEMAPSLSVFTRLSTPPAYSLGNNNDKEK